MRSSQSLEVEEKKSKDRALGYLILRVKTKQNNKQKEQAAKEIEE